MRAADQRAQRRGTLVPTRGKHNNNSAAKMSGVEWRSNAARQLHFSIISKADEDDLQFVNTRHMAEWVRAIRPLRW